MLYLCDDDLLDNGKETAWGLYRKPRFLLSGDSLKLDREILPRSVPEGALLRRSMRRRFVLYDVMTVELARLEGGNRPLSDSDDEEPGGVVAASSAEGRLARRLLEEMARLCRDRGIPFVLVIVPPFSSRALVPDVPPPELGARIDLAPVFDAYRAAHPDSALGFPFDTYWNARGQRLVAQTLADLIRARGWRPRIGP